MPDRITDTPVDAEVPDIPEILHQVLSWSIDDARARMEAGEEVVPFSALVAGDTLFTEEHGSDSPEESYASARETVQNARGAAAYVLCYDGYINLETEMLDALVAEGGVPGDPNGHAIGLVYTLNDDGTPVFAADPVYLGEAPNFMADLVPEAPADAAEGEDTEGEDANAASEDPA